MDRLMISSTGEIQTEEYWRQWTDDCWNDLTRDKDPRIKISKPVDAFERTVRILRLEYLDD